MRDERELEAEQTVGPPGIYDACRRTINANVPKACNGFEAHTWAAISAILGERKILLPACLSTDYHILTFKNQPLITGKTPKYFFKKSDAILSRLLV